MSREQSGGPSRGERKRSMASSMTEEEELEYRRRERLSQRPDDPEQIEAILRMLNDTLHLIHIAKPN